MSAQRWRVAGSRRVTPRERHLDARAAGQGARRGRGAAASSRSAASEARAVSLSSPASSVSPATLVGIQRPGERGAQVRDRGDGVGLRGVGALLEARRVRRVDGQRHDDPQSDVMSISRSASIVGRAYGRPIGRASGGPTYLGAAGSLCSSAAAAAAASRRERDAEFGEHRRDVVIDRLGRHDEPLGDLGVGGAGGEQGEDLVWRG